MRKYLEVIVKLAVTTRSVLLRKKMQLSWRGLGMGQDPFILLVEDNPDDELLTQRAFRKKQYFKPYRSGA